MSVCSLQLAAAHSLIITAYKQQKIFESLSKAAFKISLHGIAHIWTKTVLEPAESVIITLVDKIPYVYILPIALKARLAVIAFELGCQCLHFFEDITKNMQPKCEVDILLCGRNIFITQNFEIDRKKTILLFLEKSKMSVKFNAKFLMRECIEKHELETTAGRVITVEARKRKTRRNDKSFKEIKKRISETLRTYNSDNTKLFIEKSFSDTKTYNLSLTMATYFVSDFELETLMKYYFDTLELEEKRKAALESINFILEEILDINPKVLMFLGEFINDNDWSAIINLHSLQLIEAFLPSWRYRYLCVEWFKIAVANYDLETYRKFITYHLPVNKTWGDYETIELKQILRNIWLATPNEFKKDLTVQEVLEQFVILIWGDYDLYIFMIRDFDREHQKDMLASAALLAIGTHRDIVPVLMNRIRELGFEYWWNDEVISLSTFVVFICRKNIPCPENETYQALFDEIGKFYFSNRTRGAADVFKDLFLLSSSDMLELLLLYRWSSKLLVELLKWFHNGSTVRVKRFTAEMMSSGIIQKIYERIITETGKTKKADEGLLLLKIHESKRQSIRKAALLKPQVRTAIMIRHFKNKDFTIHNFELEWKLLLDDFKKNYVEEEEAEVDEKSVTSMDQSSSDYWPSYFEDRFYHEQWQQKFFEDLLVSDECLKALIHNIVHVERVTSLKKYKNRLDEYDSILSLFQEYNLALKVDKLLEKHGHPNVSDTLYYGLEEASGENLGLVRKVVDYSYRVLRAILRTRHHSWDTYDEDDDDEDIADTHLNILDLTELSIEKAKSVNLDIPVII